MTTPSTHHTIGCGGRVLQSPGDGARPTGRPTPAAPIRTTPVLRQNAPGAFCRRRFSLPQGAAHSLLARQKRMGAFYPQGRPLHWQDPAGPGKKPPQLPFKSRQNRQNVPLTGTHRRGIVSSNLKKASKRTLPGKDSREEPPLAASGSCRLPDPSHRLGAAHRYVGWDGTSRYRGHERRSFGSAKGGTVEYVCSYLTPDFSSGVGYFVLQQKIWRAISASPLAADGNRGEWQKNRSAVFRVHPRTRRKRHERGKHLHL